jgi:hypothetical protein
VKSETTSEKIPAIFWGKEREFNRVFFCKQFFFGEETEFLNYYYYDYDYYFVPAIFVEEREFVFFFFFFFFGFCFCVNFWEEQETVFLCNKNYFMDLVFYWQ